ncbi:MAG: hypothetical protein ALECFALPRED_006496 [Alectoria fallacina]|uniref:Uncharacterized protein n=1 Tax=Alectoria fallacina TaxID=1903189 RepID=A0A8H3G6R7_9LECA|nr:MAG: hypothetical protein ALECFALPRED_006496 [Alectoria fallacina]
MDGIVTTGIETSIYPISPAFVASGTATAVVMSANSNGAVTSFTTTSTYPSIPATGSRQLGPVTVETEITTTDSRGSTIVATSTYVSVATATTTHYLSTEITATCPQDNSTYYVAGEYTYEIYWGFDFYGSDLPDLRTDNLADRLLACSDYTPETGPYGAAGASCVAASFQTAGNKCYLKHGEYEINNRIPEFPAPPTTNTAVELGLGIAYTGTFATNTGTGTPGGNINGDRAVSSMETGSSPTTTPSPAIKGSPATATQSGAETTYSNISPSCSDNNTYYVDRFRLRYDIRCGLNFDDADVALQAHADAFEGCIQYCSLLKNCADVSCQDTNSYPIFTFRGYRPETAAEGTDLLTAIPTDGDLCAEGLDGQTYTNKFQCKWEILCGQTIGGTHLTDDSD